MQIIYQAGHQIDFIQCVPDLIWRRLVHPVEDAFQIALDDVERRAQLVGDVGGQVAALLVGSLKLGDHFIEALDQFPKLGRIILRDADREVPFSDRVDGVEYLVQRPAVTRIESVNYEECQTHHDDRGAAQQ